jgi:hypothetical protein
MENLLDTLRLHLKTFCKRHKDFIIGMQNYSWKLEDFIWRHKIFTSRYKDKLNHGEKCMEITLRDNISLFIEEFQKIILCKLRYNEDFVWRYFIRDIEI